MIILKDLRCAQVLVVGEIILLSTGKAEVISLGGLCMWEHLQEQVSDKCREKKSIEQKEAIRMNQAGSESERSHRGCQCSFRVF